MYQRPDSNRHGGLARRILNPLRLPISPLWHKNITNRLMCVASALGLLGNSSMRCSISCIHAVVPSAAFALYVRHLPISPPWRQNITERSLCFSIFFSVISEDRRVGEGGR